MQNDSPSVFSSSLIHPDVHGTLLKACWIQGKPWVRMVVTGQSFMLHQIRKMVGVAVAVMRGLAPKNAISLALEPRRDVNTCIAPDVGLFLDESLFDSYNTRWGINRNEAISQDAYRAEVDAFKVSCNPSELDETWPCLTEFIK